MEDRIRGLVLLYGVIPMLKFLEEQEAAENYELCITIRDVLLSFHRNNREFPIKYSQSALDIAIKSAEFYGISNENFIRNIPYRVQLIHDSVFRKK